jgi:hypothetical protein
MGYFGPTSFENDDAMDWLGERAAKALRPSIKSALSAYPKYLKSGRKGDRLSKRQIEELISMLLESWQEDPPEDWKRRRKPIKSLLEEEERKLRDEYYSGRYLDKEYGPIEPAIAAAELVAGWGGCPGTKYPREARQLLVRVAPARPPLVLVESAIDVMLQIIKDNRYRRMRTFYLDSFQDVTGGDDKMAALKDLIARLKCVARNLRGVAG